MKTDTPMKMKRMLLASLVFNAASLVAVGLLLLRTPQQVQVQVQAPAAPAAVQAKKPAAFNWAELETQDFATYVRKLREIGCPEATIQDLVEGELAEIYPDVQGQREVRAKMVATLLGPAPATATAASKSAAQAAAADPAAERAAPVSSGSDAANIPAAFLVGNATDHVPGVKEMSTTVDDPTLHPATAEVLNQMRKDFALGLEDGKQELSEREYYLKWMKEKFKSDDFFSSIYGGDALNQLQQQANGFAR